MIHMVASIPRKWSEAYFGTEPHIAGAAGATGTSPCYPCGVAGLGWCGRAEALGLGRPAFRRPLYQQCDLGKSLDFLKPAFSLFRKL